jgi:hypothetical protein
MEGLVTLRFAVLISNVNSRCEHELCDRGVTHWIPNEGMPSRRLKRIWDTFSISVEFPETQFSPQASPIWYQALYDLSDVICLSGATDPSGLRPPRYRRFKISLRHTTVGRNPLEEWSPHRETSTWPGPAFTHGTTGAKRTVAPPAQI